MVLGFALESPQGIQTALHLVRGNTSLHSSHCKETGLFSSHVISVSIPLEAANSGPSHIPIVEGSVLLRCRRNLEFLLNRSQGKSSNLEMIWCTWSFPRVALLNSVCLKTWAGVLEEISGVAQRKASHCHVRWGTGDGSGANAGEGGLILI